jgi:hypothetical protein
MAPKREFEPLANDHEAGSSRRAAPAAFDMGLPMPMRDRIYVTVMLTAGHFGPECHDLRSEHVIDS